MSRNNPDETAKNLFELNAAAGIPRRLTVLWNAVPWYIGSNTEIRAATKVDLSEGRLSLLKLLPLLPRLQGVVLIGANAQKATDFLKLKRPDLKLFNCPHPSPSNVNRAPGNRQAILEVLRSVATWLA